MTTVIRTRRLVRYFPAVRSDPIKAVDSVDCELPSGTMVVLAGPSGSGKTTLLGLMTGLDRPNSGEVELFGQSLAELSDAALALLRRRRVGLVFQDFKLLPRLASWENVALPYVPMGVPTQQRRSRAMELLEQLGIAKLADQPAEQLSGGQQQRVALARAMANDPDLLLADEPVSQVDTESAERVLATLRALVNEGKTVVVSTHDPALEVDGAQRYQMVGGRLERSA